MSERVEIRDAEFYENANRDLKVGYFVPVFIRLGFTPAQVLALPDEGWRLAHLEAEKRAGHRINPPSDETRLRIVWVLRNRERNLTEVANCSQPKAARSA